MPGELEPEEGALVYEEELGALLPGHRPPRLDLVLLGLGEDGHVASLFPGSPALAEHEHCVAATEVYGETRRLTLTLPVLASARSLLFMVIGKTKAEAVRLALQVEGDSDTQAVPARMLLDAVSIRRMAGWEYPSTVWVLDRDAASQLPPRRSRLDGGPTPR
jgi:6-phosphogluconolactonase